MTLVLYMETLLKICLGKIIHVWQYVALSDIMLHIGEKCVLGPTITTLIIFQKLTSY